MNNAHKFTCALGTFTFSRRTSLAVAKLVRDTVMGQFFNPKPGEPKLKTEVDCQEFIRNHPSHTIANVGFDLEFSENVLREQFKRRLLGAAA